LEFRKFGYKKYKSKEGVLKEWMIIPKIGIMKSTNPNNPEFEMDIDSIKEYIPDHRVFSERKQEILKYLEH
jgi:hypothetical protein